MASHGPNDPPAVAPEPLEARPAPARSVLVVDDDPAVVAVVARILRRDGAVVTAASGGRDALRAIADGRVRPTILLTDIDMPQMTGIELAARVAALRPGIRIVMMTGDPERAEAARRHRAEVGSVLLKPVSGPELLAAIREPGDGRSKA
jgi:CheY-like chemotaxis protein